MLRPSSLSGSIRALQDFASRSPNLSRGMAGPWPATEGGMPGGNTVTLDKLQGIAQSRDEQRLEPACDYVAGLGMRSEAADAAQRLTRCSEWSGSRSRRVERGA